jgi:hypothetical protein
MKFSMGHSSEFTFTIVKGEDVHWLSHPDFETMRQEYMHGGHADNNTANVKGFRRIRDAAPTGTFHRATPKGGEWLPKQIYGEQCSRGNCKAAHEEWTEHPDVPNRETYIYSDEFILGTSVLGGRKGHDYRVR